MIVDSSAIIAILRDEPDAADHQLALAAAATRRMSAATLVEAGIVAGPSRRGDLDDLVAAAGIEVVALDAVQARVALEAHDRYGRGSGSPARLNLGDCFTYALAKESGEPLLFQGDDFTHTDLASALT